MRIPVPRAMLTASLIALTLFLGACTSPTAGGRSSSSATAMAPSSPPASAAQPATFPCRLPVAYQTGPPGPDGRLSPPSGAFVAVPGGKVTADPSGGTSWGSRDENSIEMVASPRLHGYSGPSYVAATTRWVPSRTVSADGLAYTYAQPKALPAGPSTETRVHVVQAATGADRAFDTGSTKDPIAFDAAGVYLVESHWEASPGGLWRLDPATGQQRAIRTDGAWMTVGHGAAWGHLGSVGMGEPMDRVDRLDLATGRTELWLSRPGANLDVLGVDPKGRPLVQISRLEAPPGSSAEVAVLDAPGQARTLFSVPADAPVTQALADGHGLWFLTTTKLLLYQEGSGLQEISGTPPRGSSASIASLAGPCV